jgi:FkbM family methyltransferase
LDRSRKTGQQLAIEVLKKMPAPSTALLDPAQMKSLEAWLLVRSEERSEEYLGQSARFDVFPPVEVTIPAGHTHDYLGNLWPEHFGVTPTPGSRVTSIPDVTEEYFEFLDVFESVIDAQDRFTMMEWGAGFGRWTGIGVAAARLCGIHDLSVVCVEAHPLHIRHIEETFERLRLEQKKTAIYPWALSGKSGTDIFMIGIPSEIALDQPWYGQALSDFNDLKPSGKFYEGSPLLENNRGWQGIEVQVDTASSVLRNYGFVDLIDMDLQGAEADVVDECIDQLNDQVRRLHIGTHGLEIEERLRKTLSSNDWIKLRDLKVAAENDTPFGRVTCVDGVQSWFNPRFPPPGWKD